MDAINLLILIVTAVNLVSAVIIGIRSRGVAPLRSAYLLLLAVVVMWGFATLWYRSVQDAFVATVSVRLLYALGSLIPSSFVLFLMRFLERPVRSSWTVILGLLNAAIVVVALLPGGLVRGVEIVPGREHFIILNAPLHTLYVAYVVVPLTVTLFIMLGAWLRLDGIQRRQAKLIFWGSAPVAVLSVWGHLVLPALGNFDYNWVGPVATAAFSISVGYAVARHGLLNVRIIAAEIFGMLLLLLILFSLFTQFVTLRSASSRILRFSVLLLSAALVMVMRQSVVQEVRLREQALAAVRKLRAANRELRQLDDAKSEFLSIASHQLHAPLSSVKGFLSLLREGAYGALNAKQRTVVSKVLESTDRLIRFIDDFLNVSRIELAHGQYRMVPVDLPSLIQSIVDELEPQAEQKKIAVRFRPPQGLPRVIADASSIRQAILNIVDNAIKYTQKGSVEVTLVREGNHVRIAVHDTGRGISEEDRERLFRRFRRGVDAATFGEGSGLGLYVAQKIIHDHRGEIAVKSPGRDQGSTFVVTLPVEGSKDA